MYHGYAQRQLRHVELYSPMITQAAKRNLVYPNYAWIFYALYPDQWWTDDTIPVDCTNEELETFLFNSRGLLAHIVPEPDNFDSSTSAGIVSHRLCCLAAVLVHFII